eukprot:04148_6
MARDTPIDNPLWIGENRAVIAKWINEFGQQAETSQLSNMSDADFTQQSLWAVLAFICKLPRITRNPVSNFKLAEDLFNSNNIPFPYSDLPVQQWGNVVLLRASILIDKTNSRNTDEATKSIRWVPPPQRFETVTPIPLQVYDQGVLRIFLSSTFRDMQNERDQFFQHGVSQLKALAKEKASWYLLIDGDLLKIAVMDGLLSVVVNQSENVHTLYVSWGLDMAGFQMPRKQTNGTLKPTSAFRSILSRGVSQNMRSNTPPSSISRLRAEFSSTLETKNMPSNTQRAMRRESFLLLTKPIDAAKRNRKRSSPNMTCFFTKELGSFPILLHHNSSPLTRILGNSRFVNLKTKPITNSSIAWLVLKAVKNCSLISRHTWPS